MAYCIDSYEIILCPECRAKVLYDDRDVKIFTKSSYDIFYCEDKTCYSKVIKCPKCYKIIELEKLGEFKIGVDLAKEKDMGGVSW